MARHLALHVNGKPVRVRVDDPEVPRGEAPLEEQPEGALRGAGPAHPRV